MSVAASSPKAAVISVGDMRCPASRAAATTSNMRAWTGSKKSSADTSPSTPS
jgi:hypothetical protein